MKTNAQYLKAYGHCPECNSEDIEGGFIEVDADCCTQVVCCLDCACKWVDCYALESYLPLTDGKGTDLSLEEAQNATA